MQAYGTEQTYQSAQEAQRGGRGKRRERAGARSAGLRLGDRLVIAFFVGIIVGSVLVNLIPFSWVSAMNVWGAEYITGYLSKEVRFTTMFHYLLKLRGQIFGCVMILLFSPFIKKILYAAAGYVGLAWGMVSSIILMEHGINGIRICFFLVFPHFLFYGMGIGMLAYKLLKMQGIARKKADATMLLVLILAVLTMIAGVMAESFVNTSVFLKILQTY